MKTIVCTGTSGSERLQCLNAVKRLARNKVSFEILDMWRLTREVAEGSLDEATILNLAATDRSALLAKAYGEAANRLERLRETGQVNATAVATHAAFYWKSSYEVAFPVDLLDSLKPDCFVTIVHNIRDVKENLRRDPHQRFTDISLADVLRWRAEEMRRTSEWASDLKKDYYVLARSEPPQTLYSIIFEPQTKKVYTSYPMSHVDPGERRAASRFVRKLRSRGYTVFNPASIDDAEYVGRLEEERKQSGRRRGLTKRELLALAPVVGDHTVRLDYAWIEQSDLVLVRYPSVSYDSEQPLGSYVPLSAGVVCEMFHATGKMKRVYAVWLPKKPPSPFFRYYSKKVFSSERELFNFLDAHEKP